MYALRRLMQGSEQSPKAPLGNNARPLQPLHHRTVRTNIDFQNAKVSSLFIWSNSICLQYVFKTKIEVLELEK